MKELFGAPSFNIFSDAIESGRVTQGSGRLLAPTMQSIPSPIMNQTDYQNSQRTPSSIIQKFLDNAKTDPSLATKRNAVIQMIKNDEDQPFIEDAIINKMQWKEPVIENIPMAPVAVNKQ